MRCRFSLKPLPLCTIWGDRSILINSPKLYHMIYEGDPAQVDLAVSGKMKIKLNEHPIFVRSCTRYTLRSCHTEIAAVARRIWHVDPSLQYREWNLRSSADKENRLPTYNGRQTEDCVEDLLKELQRDKKAKEKQKSRERIKSFGLVQRLSFY